MNSFSVALLIIPIVVVVCIDSTKLLTLPPEVNSDQTCSSPACISAAFDLRIHMDTSVKPCDDFYNFACGKFLQNAVIADDEIFVNTFNDIQRRVDQRIKTILEQPAKSDSPKYERILKTYYNLCTNSEMIEKTGVTDMKKMLNKFGGWPMISPSWNESVDLTKLLSALEFDLGFGIIFIKSIQNDSDTTKNVLAVVDHGTTFFKDYYTEDKNKNIIEAYKEFMVNTSKLLNIYADEEHLKNDADEIINFEHNMAEFSSPPEKSRLLRQKTVTMDNLTVLFNNTIRFDEFVYGLLSKVDIEVKKDMPIAVYDYEFYKNMAGLFEKTPKRVVINYLLWKVIQNTLIALPKKFEDVATRYQSIASGSLKARRQWSKCVSRILNDFPQQLGALYVKSYFKKTIAIKIKDLIKEIVTSFKSIILNLPWLLDDTKAVAVEKLSNMRNISGYPDYFDDENLFVEMFKDVSEPETLLDEISSAASINIIENLKLIEKPANDNRPTVKIAAANAYYTRLGNSIVLPAGILQEPFFHESLPMYLNYGGIGYAIGHEITHGFDDSGKRYDKNGNLVNWWKLEDEMRFENASQCFVDQYSRFTLEDLDEHINGRLTIGENIADNGGIRAAFQAYKNWINRNGDDLPLLGLSYTPQQMFFINFARVYCEKVRPETASSRLKKNRHSPGRNRVLGTLMNFPEFSEAFNCSLGSTMNPAHKCRVW